MNVQTLVSSLTGDLHLMRLKSAYFSFRPPFLQNLVENGQLFSRLGGGSKEQETNHNLKNCISFVSSGNLAKTFNCS